MTTTFDAPGDPTPSIGDLARAAAEAEALAESGYLVETEAIAAGSTKHVLESVAEPIVPLMTGNEDSSGRSDADDAADPEEVSEEDNADGDPADQSWADDAVAAPPRRIEVVEEPVVEVAAPRARPRLVAVTDEPVSTMPNGGMRVPDRRSVPRVEEPVAPVVPLRPSDKRRDPIAPRKEPDRVPIGDNAGAHLAAFVERIERLEEEKAELGADIKDVYAEAKADGFDTKMIRRLVQRRKKDPEVVREEDEIFDLYLAAMKMV